MKDAKGHGSNTGTKGMRLIKTHTLGAHSAKVYNNPEWNEKVVKFFQNGSYQPKADYHTDDISDAHSTAQVALQRYENLSPSNSSAAAVLASGPKSATIPTHDSMGTVGRHGYNPESVSKAIANNRTGKIGGKEASAIHRLLRGRG